MTDLRVVAILLVILFAESAALYPWPRMYKQVSPAPRAAQRDRPPMPDFVPVRPYRTTPTQQFKHAPTGRELTLLDAEQRSPASQFPSSRRFSKRARSSSRMILVRAHPGW